MSGKLPVVSGQQLIKAFGEIGYYVRSQQGSHIHLRHPIRPPLTVPNHREIARGTLRAIIRQAGLSPDSFAELLKK
ncbi:MAG: type II toxin-antitoxin system HicA family toxin [Chitinispirillaceae bacterium]|nr:type II toxin-antitoxin system HicA family toxin [Chitinispirillaceae bacterium]